jgi:hypothetical protein
VNGRDIEQWIKAEPSLDFVDRSIGVGDYSHSLAEQAHLIAVVTTEVVRRFDQRTRLT